MRVRMRMRLGWAGRWFCCFALEAAGGTRRVWAMGLGGQLCPSPGVPAWL